MTRSLEPFARGAAVLAGPHVVSYNAAISACEKGRLPHKALSLLVGMRRQALSPNVITFSCHLNTSDAADQ